MISFFVQIVRSMSVLPILKVLTYYIDSINGFLSFRCLSCKRDRRQLMGEIFCGKCAKLLSVVLFSKKLVGRLF